METQPHKAADIVSSRKAFSCSHLVPQPQWCSLQHQHQMLYSVVMDTLQVEAYCTCVGRSGGHQSRGLVNRCSWSINRAARCGFPSGFCLFHIFTSSLGFSFPFQSFWWVLYTNFRKTKKQTGREWVNDGLNGSYHSPGAAKCELWMDSTHIAAWTWMTNSDIIWYPPTEPDCFWSSFEDQYVLFGFQNGLTWKQFLTPSDFCLSGFEFSFKNYSLKITSM